MKLRVGERAVVAINGGGASIRLARRADHPDRIQFFVHDCDVDTAAGPLPPLPMASGWLDPVAVRALKSAL
jgi:hypothetical protein